jgi:NADH-quinone oxidoreductase subunit A
MSTPSNFLENYVQLIIFSGIGIIFAMILSLTSKLLRSSRYTKSKEKIMPYECGIVPIGVPWVQFHIRYYIFALLFVIFDIETVFLYPWALVFKQMGMYGIVEMFIFIFVLLLGLAYPWKKGVLSWA